MHALADGLTHYCPEIRDEAYFADCFAAGVEERHGEESLAITEALLERQPALAPQVIQDARITAEALQGLWSALDDVITVAKVPS